MIEAELYDGAQESAEIIAPTLQEEQEESEGWQFTKELGGEDRVYIESRADGKLTYLETVPASSYSPDYVRDKWGGGDYRVSLIWPNGRWKERRTLSIDRRCRPKVVPVESAGPVPMFAGVDPLARMERMLERAIEAQQTVKAAPVVAALDPVELFKQFAGIVKEIIPTSQSAGANMKETVELAKTLMSFGREMAEEVTPHEGGDGPPWGMIIEKGITPLVELAARGGRQPTPAIPAAAPRALPAVTPTTPTPEGPMWFVELARLFPLILARAKKDADPVTTAAFVLDELSEAAVTQIAALAAQEGFVDKALTVLPAEFGTYAEWAREFLGAVPAVLASEEEQAPESEPEHGPGLRLVPPEGSGKVSEVPPLTEGIGEDADD
ncbi:MAG: hypothetical protein ACRD0K_10115 [Egibacteraceae bacterium]